eukprot:jgi/Tetstr1/449728/TSEL_036795.t1
MLSMDLHDGFYAVGIARPEDRDYYTIEYRGKLYVWRDFPCLGWSLSPYYLCSLTAAFNRHLRRPDFTITSHRLLLENMGLSRHPGKGSRGSRSAYTVETFIDLVAKAFSPTPEIAEHSFSLDFSEWLRAHFHYHINDMSKPHKFEFTRDDAAASGGSLRAALWSNTPLSEPVQILKNAPIGTPEIRAGRPLLYALCDKKKPDALKV